MSETRRTSRERCVELRTLTIVCQAVGSLAHRRSRTVSGTRRTAGARRADPGAASGWYCTAKIGSSRCRSPSIGPVVEVHVRHLEVRRARESPLSSPSTANPWFCDVIRTRPVSSSSHRMIPAAVAVGHLHRRAAEGEPEQLVPEADAEDRDLLLGDRRGWSRRVRRPRPDRPGRSRGTRRPARARAPPRRSSSPAPR